MTKNYISPKLIILCMVFCLSSVYLILTNGLLPLNGKIDAQDLISCIIVPIIQVVSFRLLITRHDKITEKFGAVLTAAFVHYGRVEVCLYVVSLFLLKLVWNYRRSLRHFNLCSCTFGVCCGVICCFHSVLSFISKVNFKKISGTYRLKSVFTLTNSSGKSETITVYSDEEMVG